MYDVSAVCAQRLCMAINIPGGLWKAIYQGGFFWVVPFPVPQNSYLQGCRAFLNARHIWPGKHTPSLCP